MEHNLSINLMLISIPVIKDKIKDQELNDGFVSANSVSKQANEWLVPRNGNP